jgi:uncharacterized protein (DUF934 family)
MRRILRRHEIVPDEWRHLGEDANETDALIIPSSELRTNSAAWHARRGRLGVRLAPADRTEDLADELSRLALVAVEFPGPSEGRGYTHGRLLRGHLHFKGELRAVGAGVKQDLIFLLARCGFDSFELAPGQNVDEAVRALERYSVAYQPAEPHASIRKQRFFA